jgi:hypothetical protein
MTYEWHDLVGNCGVLLVLGTYLFVQMGRMDIRRPGYSLANALGAILIIVSLMHDFNLSSFIIEISWLAISLYGLSRWLRDRAETRTTS